MCATNQKKEILATVHMIWDGWVDAVNDVYADAIERCLHDPEANPKAYAKEARQKAIGILKQNGYDVYRAADGMQPLIEGRSKALAKYGMNPSHWT